MAMLFPLSTGRCVILKPWRSRCARWSSQPARILNPPPNPVARPPLRLMARRRTRFIPSRRYNTLPRIGVSQARPIQAALVLVSRLYSRTWEVTPTARARCRADRAVGAKIGVMSAKSRTNSRLIKAARRRKKTLQYRTVAPLLRHVTGNVSKQLREADKHIVCRSRITVEGRNFLHLRHPAIRFRQHVWNLAPQGLQ